MIPHEIQVHIKSYLDTCRYCRRNNIAPSKIYCDTECYYIYKKKELFFFRNALLLYTILFLYGNLLLKVYGAIIVLIAAETLF
jgi:hypothetical protein